MLEVLRAVVQEVNAAPGLDDALRVIVSRVKPVMGLDVCSVYLTNSESTEHVLRATDGFDPEMVGQVVIPFGHGLVGLVAERAEPVNLADGHQHPRFHFVEETGEIRLHGFLGVPIVRHRKVLGVIVAQREDIQDFNDDEVSLLVTLAAQLAGAITHAETVGEVKRSRDFKLESNRVFDGLPGAPGIAIGEAVVVYSAADLNSVPDRATADPVAEEAEFMEAVANVRDEINELSGRMQGVLPDEERAVFDAFCAMLSGDSLVTETVDRIRAGSWAPSAWRDTVQEHARVFESMADPYLAERASDIRDLGQRVLTRLQARTSETTEYPENAVLVGEEISAMDLAEADVHSLAGVVSIHGSGYSHVAILARALGIPC
ncbi:MAG: phosphoenolpyruvate-utilizing N-terminal domain-containing protein, partial [Gammaproteobacteria bacterium]